MRLPPWVDTTTPTPSLANARNAEIRAETDYNKALSDLQRVTATSFRANNITLASPVEIK